MLIAPYSICIEVGQIYYQGNSFDILWRVEEWETYRGVSQITLKNIDNKGIPTGKVMKVLSFDWLESEFHLCSYALNLKSEF